jgi:hypothetical protein
MAAIEAAIVFSAMPHGRKTCTTQTRMISDFYRLPASLSIISSQIVAPILIFQPGMERVPAASQTTGSTIPDAQRARRVPDVQTAN